MTDTQQPRPQLDDEVEGEEDLGAALPGQCLLGGPARESAKAS